MDTAIFKPGPVTYVLEGISISEHKIWGGYYLNESQKTELLHFYAFTSLPIVPLFTTKRKLCIKIMYWQVFARPGKSGWGGVKEEILDLCKFIFNARRIINNSLHHTVLSLINWGKSKTTFASIILYLIQTKTLHWNIGVLCVFVWVFYFGLITSGGMLQSTFLLGLFISRL